MLSKIAGICTIAMCIIAVGTYAGILSFGMGVDTDTKAYSWCGDHPIKGLTSPELTDEDELVTAWKTGANSVKLTIEGRARFPNCNGVGWTEFHPSRFYYKIYLNDEDNCILWRTNYDRDIIHITHPTSGHSGDANLFGLSYFTSQADRLDEKGKKIASTSKWASLGACGKYTTVVGDALSIEIKGPRVGKIIVEFWVEVGCNWWGDVHTEPRRFQRDEVKLISGSGEVEIEGNQDVYEESETITFCVDTGFSGRRQGGEVSSDGWELRIYDASGDKVKSWDIGDDKSNLKKTYEIPSDAYDSSGDNKWKVELWNTLFKQSERHFFTIGEGMKDQMPDLPVISFDKNIYDMGDTCYVTVTSEPGEDDKNGIYEFFVKAYMGTAGVNYLYGPDYVRASGDSATFSFSVTRADRYITVEANAFSGPHNQGGIPSETGKSTVYAQDKNPEPDTYILTVFVRFDETKELVEGVTVDCGIETAKTGTDGRALLIGLPGDTYGVTAVKGDLKGSQSVVVASDTSATIYLKTDIGIPYLNIIIAAAIAVIAILIGIFAPGPPIYKLIIMIAGVVLAILVYYFGGVV